MRFRHVLKWQVDQFDVHFYLFDFEPPGFALFFIFNQENWNAFVVCRCFVGQVKLLIPLVMLQEHKLKLVPRYSILQVNPWNKNVICHLRNAKWRERVDY